MYMAKGDSGRIVIEVDPDLKRRLYSALALESLTLKDWFIKNVSLYLSEKIIHDFPEEQLKN